MFCYNSVGDVFGVSLENYWRRWRKDEKILYFGCFDVFDVLMFLVFVFLSSGYNPSSFFFFIWNLKYIKKIKNNLSKKYMYKWSKINMYLKKVTKLFKRRNSNKSKNKKEKQPTFYDPDTCDDIFVAEHVDILRHANTKNNDQKSRKKRARKARKSNP